MSSQSPENIRRRMQNIRGKLDSEVEGIIGNARQLVSWKHYVRAYPWPSMLAAAAIGYLAIPRRLETVRPDAETMAQLARDKRLVVDHRPLTHKKPGVVQSMVSMAGNTLLRAALVYAGRKAGKMFADAAAENEES